MRTWDVCRTRTGVCHTFKAAHEHKKAKSAGRAVPNACCPTSRLGRGPPTIPTITVVIVVSGGSPLAPDDIQGGRQNGIVESSIGCLLTRQNGIVESSIGCLLTSTNLRSKEGSESGNCLPGNWADGYRNPI